MAVEVRLSDDEAQQIAGAAESCREEGRLDSAGFPSELLARAGATVLRALRRQSLELERERARSYRDEVSRVPGARLIDGDDGGGRRHYLRGEPVHCGDGVYLLTLNGWMAGRYERAANRATFWFSLPGVAEQSVIPIQPDMLFAWPSELTAGRRVDLPNGPRVAGV
jgi:hypothetical protein